MTKDEDSFSMEETGFTGAETSSIRTGQGPAQNDKRESRAGAT